MHENTVVIVGAGMAGLTTAAYLALAGFPVKVYEQHTQCGGYVSSFVRQGYRFPAGPTGFGSNGIVFPILRELGLQNDLRFVRARHQISYQGHDIPLRDPAQTARALQRCFPHEKDALNRYFRWVNIGGNAFFDSLKNGMMFGRNILKTILRLGFVHPLFPWASRKAKKHTNQSLHAHYFKDVPLRQLLDGLGYPVMSGENTLGMWASYYYDTWVPVGGMQVFSDLFVRFVQKSGGEVHLNAGVRRIRVENGQASGVELQNGESVPAGWVVSAADLNHTCFSLIGPENLPLSMTEKLGYARPSESLFAVFLGLHDSPEVRAALKRFEESHVTFTCADGKTIQLVLLSMDDASAAPMGKHSLFVGSLSPFEDWEPFQDDRQAYEMKKAAFAAQLITRAEEFLPGLRSHIEVTEAASPLTYARYTSNWRGGTSGWNWDPAYTPHFDFAKDMPIGHFYPVGHYVHNPGGVPTAMITAWYIARDIIRQAGK